MKNIPNSDSKLLLAFTNEMKYHAKCKKTLNQTDLDVTWLRVKTFKTTKVKIVILVDNDNNNNWLKFSPHTDNPQRNPGAKAFAITKSLTQLVEGLRRISDNTNHQRNIRNLLITSYPYQYTPSVVVVKSDRRSTISSRQQDRYIRFEEIQLIYIECGIKQLPIGVSVSFASNQMIHSSKDNRLLISFSWTWSIICQTLQNNTQAISLGSLKTVQFQ